MCSGTPHDCTSYGGVKNEENSAKKKNLGSSVHLRINIHWLYQPEVKPSTYRRWTVAELKKVIAMLQHPDLDSKTSSHKSGPDDISFLLVFFSTFEELTLPIQGPMEDAGVVKHYELSPTPCFYVAPAENMVGRIPLMTCFLDGNATPTIPHTYSKNKASCFPAGCADAAAEDDSPWCWQFGRGKPRIF
jgi:hypothetical protein